MDRETPLGDRLGQLSAAQRAVLAARSKQAEFAGPALVAAGLAASGIRLLIGVTGTPIDRIFGDCARRGVRLIGTRHQSAAVLMAASVNYVAGEMIAAVLVSAGPAVTNTLTGALVARDNGWPVVILGGRRPVQGAGSGYFQELDARPIFGPVTKGAFVVERAVDLVDTILEGAELAWGGRPGPVYIDLPEDVLQRSAPMDKSRHLGRATRRRVPGEFVRDTAERLRGAARPLLVIGEEARWSVRPDALSDLVEEGGIPFVTTSLARGYLPDTHPRCANLARREVLGQADLVVLAGAWMDWRFRYGTVLAEGATLIHVQLNEETLGRNAPNTRAACGDAGEFLVQLSRGLQEGPKGDGEAVGTREVWHEEVARLIAIRTAQRDSWLATKGPLLAPQHIMATLEGLIPDDATVVLDGSLSLAAGHWFLRARRVGGWLDPGWNGCMGVGLPFGLGARLAGQDGLVVVVCGDFSAGHHLMELETAVRHRLSLVLVVCNNSGICGALRQKNQLPAGHPERFSMFEPGTAYERIAEALGAYGELVETGDQLAGAFARATRAGRAACLHVRVDPDATPLPPW